MQTRRHVHSICTITSLDGVASMSYLCGSIFCLWIPFPHFHHIRCMSEHGYGKKVTMMMMKPRRRRGMFVVAMRPGCATNRSVFIITSTASVHVDVTFSLSLTHSSYTHTDTNRLSVSYHHSPPSSTFTEHTEFFLAVLCQNSIVAVKVPVLELNT